MNIYISSLHHAFMHLCIYLYTSTSSSLPIHLLPEPWGVLQQTWGLHLSPIVFTSKRMGGILSSNISISHSSTFPTDTQIPVRIFITCFSESFLDFLYQIAYSSTQWMVVLVFCLVVGSYPVRRDPFIRYLDKTSLFKPSIFSTSIC